MKLNELRELIHNSIQRPIRICMDDGRRYDISHPDYAMVSPGAILLAEGPGHKLGASFVICWMDHVARVEVQDKPKSKAKA